MINIKKIIEKTTHDTFTIEFHLLGFWLSLGIWQKRHFRIPFKFGIYFCGKPIISICYTLYANFNSLSISIFKFYWCSAQKEHDKTTSLEHIIELI